MALGSLSRCVKTDAPVVVSPDTDSNMMLVSEYLDVSVSRKGRLENSDNVSQMQVTTKKPSLVFSAVLACL